VISKRRPAMPWPNSTTASSGRSRRAGWPTLKSAAAVRRRTTGKRGARNRFCPIAAALHDYLAEVKDAILARPDAFHQKPPAEGEGPAPVDPYLEFRVKRPGR